mmetsp:Transcript_101400/g.262527  ORF Transcript_101400/g.262527 Transcript_101400/m.262527 type:complete len:904 (+) Transcript_101400:115-2826(+)
MAPTSTAPLLQRENDAASPRASQREKPLTWFGYLPIWSECVPLDAATGSLDWAGVAANVGAGLVIGMREALGGIVSASLIFSTADISEVSRMFPFGIGMMWYSTSLGALWYAIFGRLQYAYGTAQDVIGILQAVMVARIAEQLLLAGEPEKIPATAIAVICLSAVLTGMSSFMLGKLGLGKFALLFPSPVTNGFLGAIGFVILRSSLQTSSGVKFQYFYPVSIADFCRPSSIAQVGLQVATVATIRLGPLLLELVFPGSASAQKIGSVAFQLLPLVLFHVVIYTVGISMDSLTREGWVYPKETSGGLLGHWTAYSVDDVHWPSLAQSVFDMPPLILMSVLCTATGALTVTDRFPKGPDGDPAPMEALNFDRELTTVGVSSVLLGFTGGTLTFHTFTSIQLRLDGGTHRISVFCVALFVFGALASGVPFGHYIPKWFLSGLFMNTAFHFLKGALLSYQSLPKVYWRGHTFISLQYMVTLLAIVTSIFFSPADAIFFGLILSVILFLVQSARASPVINVLTGNRVVSRTKRPFWEMQVLRAQGHRILLLYLQGQLFFGSAQRLNAVLSAAIAGKDVRYCILSFARVPLVDPSAARHLKNMKEKAKLVGCKVICCRTNHAVFGALIAADVITDPDEDLIMYLRGLKWRTKSTRSSKNLEHKQVNLPSPRKFASPSPGPLIQAEPDAFAHETDALDYCDELLVKDFCYCGNWRYEMTDFQVAYRDACTEGIRIDEHAFEDMHNLRRGLMADLKSYCEILDGLTKWDKVADDSPKFGSSLCFIMRGSVSLVQFLAQADQQDMLLPQVRGFSFREGKRLRRRYPPGHVVGKVAFFLDQEDKHGCRKVLSRDLLPNLVVSSKFGATAEIWVLKRSVWDSGQFPAGLKAELTKMLCEQLADDAQHANLQEH